MRYPDFSSFHFGTAPPGRHFWRDGRAYSDLTRPRGCVSVEDDGSTYFYRVSRTDRRAFRKWAESVFPSNGARLLGSWPAYRVGPQP